MNSLLFGLIASGFYLIATALLIKTLKMDYTALANIKQYRIITFLLAWLAVIFHGLALFNIFRDPNGINLNFFNVSALAALIVVWLLLMAALTKPVDKLGILIFPVAALILLLKFILPEEAHILKDIPWGMEFHILVSILSYSLLNIAAVQALLLALQDWQLRNRQPNRFIRSLPPLQTMESLLFQIIAAGLVLLSLSLISGFVFVEDVFAQHLAHKTVLSLLAWIVFAVLLWGRALHGWRGRTAIRWTLSGFISLMLAYFGSKMVLELILHRT